MNKNQTQKNIPEQDERPPIRFIKDIEAEHPDEWVIIEITKMAEDGFTPLEGRLMAYGKKRDEVHQKTLQYREKYDVHSIYRNYTGEIKVEAVWL